MTRHPLNPCDYLYYAQHDLMQRRGLVGNPILMVLDVAGQLAPARLEAALLGSMRNNPILASNLRIGLLSGRPAWIEGKPLDAITIQTHTATTTTELDAIAQRCFNQPIDVTKRPQVFVDLIRFANQTRLCFRWAHALMDAEGGQLLMREINRADESTESTAATKPVDARTMNPLRSIGLLKRMNLFRAGLRNYRMFQSEPPTLHDGPESGTWRYLHRRWNAAAMSTIRERVEELCPTGKARVARYLAASVFRALRRIYEERGDPRQSFLITMPQRARNLPAERPLTGNYLTSASLFAQNEMMNDGREFLNELDCQLNSFTNTDADLANWAMIWVAGWMRAGQYRRMLASPTKGFQPYASGFSYYGEIDPPLRQFLGTDVLNFWGTTTMPVPPGWNPAFARFGDSLNFVLSWLDGYINEKTAKRYAELIEAEILGQSLQEVFSEPRP